MFDLSISNIGWTAQKDLEVYSLMKKNGFQGLEIAPTRIFSENPYDKLRDAEIWSGKLKTEFGFTVPSMQSIWYGRQEKIFESEEERTALVDYTKKAIDFAAVIGCKNLVFGCPRNRNVPSEYESGIGIKFFKEIGDYAVSQGTVIGMEANPPIYHTNFINDTLSALELIEQVDSDGFKLNLDLGTVIQNNEDISEIIGKVHIINHVHISEPGLMPIEKRQVHTDLRDILVRENYQGYVSVEMGTVEDIFLLEEKMEYVNELFNNAR